MIQAMKMMTKMMKMIKSKFMNLKLFSVDQRTKSMAKSRLDLDGIKKASLTVTFFTLMKGFVGTGILFLPKGFANAGWLFAICSLFLSFVLTSICCLKLLVVREHNRGGGLTDIGLAAYGKTGKIMVDVTLAMS
jgi:hypothetical protein